MVLPVVPGRRRRGHAVAARNWPAGWSGRTAGALADATDARPRRTVAGRSRSGFLSERSPMSDKSPRQSMSKTSSKSIKEKRAEKRNKGTEETFSEKVNPSKKK